MRFTRDGDDEFRLIDPLDRSSYMTTQHWFESAMNPCIESTYTFIDRVISRIVKLHSRIQPLRVISIRGDEVPDGAWTDSPACNKFLRRFPKYRKLGNRFTMVCLPVQEIIHSLKSEWIISCTGGQTMVYNYFIPPLTV